MALSQKHVFWEALIIAIFIFGVGFFIGLSYENYLTQQERAVYLDSESTLLDIRIFLDQLEDGKITCDEAMGYNIEFGNKIFEDAQKLTAIEEKIELTQQIESEHRRFDTLRTLFWINTEKVKERCSEDIKVIVYLYDFKTTDSEELSKQEIFSRFLENLKQEFGDEIILIPIAKDLGLVSLESIISKYEISDVSVIVNKDKVYSEVEDLHKIPLYLTS